MVVKHEREKRGLMAFNSCMAKVGIIHYMRLLSSLYLRDASQKTVRHLIVKLFANENWRSLPAFGVAQSQQIAELTVQVESIREASATLETRDFQMQQQMMDYLQEKFASDLESSQTSKLQAQSCEVYLNGLYAQ
jgi:hypothetical protein